MIFALSTDFRPTMPVISPALFMAKKRRLCASMTVARVGIASVAVLADPI